MSANNFINLNLIKYSAILSFLIFFNYFLWTIDSPPIIRFINFAIISFAIIYFFISKNFNNFWYLKIIIFLLFLICLGTPTIPIDSRTLFLFPAKMLFYESDLYFRLENYFYPINHLGHNFLDTVYSRPKLAVTLSATFAQIIGLWNDIFPRATNIIIILPPIIFLISFFKDKIFIILWLFLMLFFSGKLFINGLMDGILSLYFISSLLVVYLIQTNTYETQKKLLYFIMLIFLAILSLSKHEGAVIVLAILLSSIFVGFYYDKKVDYKILIITIISLLPIIFWRYVFLISDSKMEFLDYGNPINRFFARLTNPDDLLTLFSFLINNDKFIISLFTFVFVAFKYFKNNKRLIVFISINFLFYFSALLAAILLSTHTVLEQLEQSSARIFIPLVLMLVYFSIFIVKNNYSFEKKTV